MYFDAITVLYVHVNKGKKYPISKNLPTKNLFEFLNHKIKDIFCQEKRK